MRCGQESCDGTLQLRTVDFDAGALIGLPVVIHEAAEERYCPLCGHVAGISVPDEEGAEKAAAVIRVQMPMRLTAQEIRFLRRAAGFRSNELAEKMDVDASTVTRWEKGNAMGSKEEIVFRMLIARSLAGAAPGVDCDVDALLKLKITAVQSKPVVIHLVRLWVKLTAEKKKTQAWDIFEPQQAIGQ